MADGHVLLEDYPGSGKTTLAKTLGESIIDDLPDDDIPDFRRIQFTPDLLPSDVTGMTIFDSDTKTFQFRRGPIFAYVVLGDEINRTSPKVQSAMLEAMAEKQVTVDNVSHKLDELFFVIATQNPLDLAGTYPVPTAQLDRFLFKIRMEFIDRDSEIEVLSSEAERAKPLGDEVPRVNRGDIVRVRKMLTDEVHVNPKINECLVDIARALRDHPDVSLGGVHTLSGAHETRSASGGAPEGPRLRDRRRHRLAGPSRVQPSPLLGDGSPGSGSHHRRMSQAASRSPE